MAERRPFKTPPFSLFLKALLSATVVSGTLFMLIAVGLGYGVGDSLIPVAVIAIVFAVMVSVPVVLLLGPAQGTSRVRPTSSVRLSADYDGVFDRCVQAAASADGFRIVRNDPLRGVIVARVSPTWKSFGETLRVTIRRTSGGSEVCLSSKPRVPFTLMDQGKNEQNLELLRERLVG